MSGGDLSGYTGCWKLENEPFYFVINEEFEWIAINLYGEQVGPGYVVNEGECITLYMEDDSALALWQTAYGDLSDANGNTLTPMDYIMLLPTPEDELRQTASFPGGFTNVTINYPIQMAAHEHPNVSNALSFNAVMEDGTDDYYSNIMIAFQPIEGFDPYMEKGAAAAKTYMMKMLEDFMKSMYGSYLIKSFGSDFKDNGDYYSLTGYMWLDGDIFSDGPSQPVRGCMEVRYYGPTGYALVATTIALEGRIRNYFDICNNMLTTLSYTAGWSTAPKARPAYSGDTGDYGTPYYWYDEDGDIWYWNGYENGLMATAATATSMRTAANTWSPTTRAGTMTTSITTIMIHGPIPATAGATTRTTKTAGAITSDHTRRKEGFAYARRSALIPFFLLSLGGGIVLLALRKKRGGVPLLTGGIVLLDPARLRWRCIWQRQCCWCWLCAEKRKNIIGFHRYLKTAP